MLLQKETCFHILLLQNRHYWYPTCICLLLSFPVHAPQQGGHNIVAYIVANLTFWFCSEFRCKDLLISPCTSSRRIQHFGADFSIFRWLSQRFDRMEIPVEAFHCMLSLYFLIRSFAESALVSLKIRAIHFLSKLLYCRSRCLSAQCPNVDFVLDISALRWGFPVFQDSVCSYGGGY